MPRFEVLEKSFIGTRIYEVGEHVEFDGLPGANLKPLDKLGEAAAEKAAAAEGEALLRQQAAANTGDPDNAKKLKKAT